MVEAVLSDIDGTLVESNWLHAATWREAFAVIDIPLDIETLRKQIGKGGDKLIPLRPLVETPHGRGAPQNLPQLPLPSGLPSVRSHPSPTSATSSSASSNLESAPPSPPPPPKPTSTPT